MKDFPPDCSGWEIPRMMQVWGGYSSGDHRDPTGDCDPTHSFVYLLGGPGGINSPLPHLPSRLGKWLCYDQLRMVFWCVVAVSLVSKNNFKIHFYSLMELKNFHQNLAGNSLLTGHNTATS